MRRDRPAMAAAAAALALTLSLASPADGQFITWVGPPAGDWGTGANWSGGAVPTATSDVRIDGGAGQDSTVTLDISTAIRSLDVSTGDRLLIGGGRELTLGARGLATTVSGAGGIVLSSGAGAPARLFSEGTVNFLGGGTLSMDGFPGLRAHALNLGDYRFVGVGSISGTWMSVGTGGFVEARPPAGAGGLFGTLFLTSELSAVPLAGTLSAAGGGTLAIAAATIEASTGHIRAADGGTVALTRNIVIRGGTLATAGSGLIVAQAQPMHNALELRDVNLAGRFHSERQQTRISGRLNNSGTLTIDALGAALSLGAGTTEVVGGGRIALTGYPVLSAATATLHHAGHTIAGHTDATGIAIGTLLNDAGGVIDANTAGQRLTLAPTAGLINGGLLQASNGGELYFGGDLPTVQNRFGTIAARGAGSRVTMDRTRRIFGGTLETDAVGEIVFDAPAGTLTLDNVVNLGRLRVQSGTLAGGASGIILNAGTLSVATIGLAGSVELQGGGQFNVNGWVQFVERLINSGNRISGTGLLDGLDNRPGGVVDADGTNFSVRSSHGNAGLMRAISGGTLFVSFINNAGGRIEAAAGSQVRLSGTTVGGTLAAASAGSITPNGFATIRGGLTILGPGTFGGVSDSTFFYPLNDGQSLTLGDNPVLDGGTFTVAGTASLNLVGSTRAATFKDLALNAGTATLHVGPGSINLQGHVVNRLSLHLSGGTSGFGQLHPVGVATLSGGGTITGAGGGPGGGRLINLDNTIFLDSAFFGLWDGGWENYGALRGRGGASHLRIRHLPTTTTVNRGVISAGAFTRLDLVGQNVNGSLATLDNAGGVLDGGNNGTLVIENVLVRGGTLDARFGQIRAADSGTLTLQDVTIAGHGLTSSTGRLHVPAFLTLAPDASLTVGDPAQPGGQLSIAAATLSGGGTIRVMPGGAILGHGPARMEGVKIVGLGNVGSGSTSFLIDANSAIIARPIPGTSGEQVMNLRPGRFSSLINSGMLAAETGARLHLSVPQPSALFTGSDGSIVVQAGAVVSTAASVTTGVIQNDGTLHVMELDVRAIGDVVGSGHTRLDAGFLTTGRMRQSSASLGGTSLMRLNSGASRLNELSIAGEARLELNAALVLDYAAGNSPLEQVRAWVTSGYAGGAWNGNGIRSSNAAQQGGTRTAIGYADAAELGLAGGIFMGEPLDATAVLLRYTWAGDADLDGTVGVADFARLAAAFNAPAAWAQGDFNYDGTAGIADFALLAGNFNRVLARRGSTTAPEPASGLIAAAAATLLPHRRRRPAARP